MTRLVLAVLALLLAAACSGDDARTTSTPPLTTTTAASVTVTSRASATSTTAPTIAPTTVPTMAPTPTATSAITPIPSEFTGLPAVDAVIAAVLNTDLDRLAGLVQLRSVPCGPQSGAGSPPNCPAGQPTGTPVQVFPVATCEGEWRAEAAVRASLQPLLSAPQLYAVYGMPSQFQQLMPDGQYVAVFSRTAPGQGRVGAGVVIAGGHIVGVWYGCNAPADQIVPAGTSTILAPKP